MGLWHAKLFLAKCYSIKRLQELSFSEWTNWQLLYLQNVNWCCHGNRMTSFFSFPLSLHIWVCPGPEASLGKISEKRVKNKGPWRHIRSYLHLLQIAVICAQTLWVSLPKWEVYEKMKIYISSLPIINCCIFSVAFLSNKTSQKYTSLGRWWGHFNLLSFTQSILYKRTKCT